MLSKGQTFPATALEGKEQKKRIELLTRGQQQEHEAKGASAKGWTRWKALFYSESRQEGIATNACTVLAIGKQFLNSPRALPCLALSRSSLPSPPALRPKGGNPCCKKIVGAADCWMAAS